MMGNPHLFDCLRAFAGTPSTLNRPWRDRVAAAAGAACAGIDNLVAMLGKGEFAELRRACSA